MSKDLAEKIADLFGVEAVHTGGNHWVVRFENSLGHIVILTEDFVSEYENEDDYVMGEEFSRVDLS